MKSDRKKRGEYLVISEKLQTGAFADPPADFQKWQF